MICLITMPFRTLGYPVIATSLIAAVLKNAGMDAKALYFNFDLAREIGYLDYEILVGGKTIPPFLLEWPFAGLLWGWGEERMREAGRRTMERAAIGPNDPIAKRLNRITWDLVPPFMERCVEKIASIPDVSIAAFSSIAQVVPSLAMGRALRDAIPSVKLVYGGAAFHGEIGEEIFDKLDWIDALSNSEADDVIADIFRRLSEDEPLDGLQGVMYRDRAAGSAGRTPGAQVALGDFDNGIVPDFDDYFETVRAHGLMPYYEDKSNMLALPFESSRGCWWHERSPCTFCGVNGLSDAFRMKDPENVMAAIRQYRERYGALYFFATDTNLSMDCFKTLLPRMREEFAPSGARFFYCVKSNMNRREIRDLADSGVYMAQPGIESLSDNILRLMNKGVSAIQNIFFLKCARQYGVYILWGLLIGSFGETQADFDEMTVLIPKIVHLIPPAMSGTRILIHRYSVYWRESGRYFDEMRPAEWYEWLFPDFFDYGRLAYEFDVKWNQSWDEASISRGAFTDAVIEWRRRWGGDEEPRLCFIGAEMALYDSRCGRRKRIALEPHESAIYEALDDIAARRDILERASAHCSPEDAERALDSFVAHGFAVRYGELYLGLAVREGFKEWSRDERLSFKRN
jgi:ribosomal peptide maturation radical SAM protein 1